MDLGCLVNLDTLMRGFSHGIEHFSIIFLQSLQIYYINKKITDIDRIIIVYGMIYL